MSGKKSQEKKRTGIIVKTCGMTEYNLSVGIDPFELMSSGI